LEKVRESLSRLSDTVHKKHQISGLLAEIAGHQHDGQCRKIEIKSKINEIMLSALCCSHIQFSLLKH